MDDIQLELLPIEKNKYAIDGNLSGAREVSVLTRGEDNLSSPTPGNSGGSDSCGGCLIRLMR